jgi:environmental stress-induced protein Ves
MIALQRARNLGVMICAAWLAAACSNGRGSVDAEGGQTNFTVGGSVTGLEGTGLVLQVNGAGDLSLSANGAFTFAGPMANGAAYDVTIKTQPANPAQTCAVSSGAGRITGANVSNVAVVCTTGSTAFTVGGAVTGLVGSGLVLRNNGVEDLPITADGEFIFPTTVATGAAYSVIVAMQPANPTQTCSVEDGDGVMGASDVTSVRVICSTSAFTIGGTVSGLRSLGLQLKNNDEILGIGGDGPFTFRNAVASGASYAVSVQGQPQGQNCVVQNGAGTVQSANVTDVSVVCASNVYTIGGSIGGLAPGARVVLRMDAGGQSVDHTATRNGAFTFERSLTNGTGYVVTVATDPVNPAQTCTVANAAGVVNGANVTNVAVTCTTRRFTVGGMVEGLQGSGLVLRLNGANDLSIASNGSFTFDTPLDSGARYEVTVAAQPVNLPQTCTVQHGTGAIGNSNVRDVRVTCAVNRYSIGGTVSGLAGGRVVLQNNGGDPVEVAGNGAFTFPTQIASGGTYNVTVRTSPSNPTQSCTVANGSGTVGAAAVTNVVVNCTTSSFTVGGQITGLAGSGLVLLNNGADNLTVSPNATSFTFATPVASGAAYQVTIATQPTGPLQSCSVANGSGVVGAGNVTSVQVTCTTIEFTVGGAVSGLSGSGLVLQNNGGDNLPIAADGPFTFPDSLAQGEPYNVAVGAQPANPSQTCVVANGSGTMGNGDVTNIAVTCTTNNYTIGGVVSGASVFGVFLRNNGGDNIQVFDGPFTFPTPVLSGATYSVTASTPFQTCTVVNGEGTVGGGNVTDIAVTCQ